MDKTDARKLKPEVQQKMRNQATRLRKSGKKAGRLEKLSEFTLPLFGDDGGSMRVTEVK